MQDNKRKCTRNRMWPDTEAVISFRDSTGLSSKTMNVVTGHVENLGGDGCFVLTNETVPNGTKVDIVIDFQPGSAVKIRLDASGKVIRNEDKGIAIKFTALDLKKLGECILEKLNSM